MKKVFAIILALALFTALISASAFAAESKGTLNLYTWAEMFDPDVLAEFERESGYQINYVNFDLDETMLAKLESANGGDYDLIIADDYIIETVIAEGLAQKLDREKLPNFGNLNPLYQGQFYDPADEYTVPYGAGVQTIVYNPSLVDLEVKGYKDLWDASFENNVAITANYRVMIGMALKVLGYSYNTNDLDELEEAAALFYKLAPNIRLIKDDFIQDDLVSGEVSAAVMYTSQVTAAMRADPELKVVYPEEGIGFGIMGMFIPSQAPNAEAAYAFVDYILRPEISEKCFEYENFGYYCTNKAAEPLLPEELQEFLVLPEEINMEGMEMIGNINAEAEGKQAEIWMEFKTLCGQ